MCGNEKVDAGEVCDNGDKNGVPGACNKTCSGIVPECGNGKVEEGEFCDDAEEGGEPGKCKLSCDGYEPGCGNLEQEGELGEACDGVDGVPDVNTTFCNAQCQLQCKEGWKVCFGEDLQGMGCFVKEEFNCEDGIPPEV